MKDQEAQFFAKLLETFRLEAEEHLKVISDGFLALESPLEEEKRAPLVEKVFREVHSLKGAARSVNQEGMQAVCQALENVLASWKQGIFQPSQENYTLFHQVTDSLKEFLHTKSNPERVHQLAHDLETALRNREESSPRKNLEAVLPRVEELMQAEKPKKIVQESAPTGKTIRISLDKVGRLFQGIEEMLIVKLVSKQSVLELKALLNAFQLREKEWTGLLNEAKRPLASVEKQLIMGKSLGNSLLEFTKTAEQHAHFVSTLVDTLLEDVKKILMQPISVLFEGIPRMVRDIALQLKKEVQFVSSGGEIEIDRRVLEEVKDPLIHLIRNAIDHGVESPEERERCGKPVQGVLRITASETGNGHIELQVADDGAGLDFEKIKAEALKQGLFSPEEVDQFSEEKLAYFLLHSGISTSSTVTELSGRGLGLGIVSEKIDKLGGQIFVDSSPGRGTTFRLLLPSTLATFRGVYTTVGGKDFILPAHNVKRVLRLEKSAIKVVENSEVVSIDGRPVGFVQLSSLLGLGAEQTKDPIQLVVLVKADEKLVAFGVDAIHREHEVLVKGLGPQLLHVKNVMAATIMESGRVIPILNPVELVRSARGVMTHSLEAHASLKKETRRAKVVLVAEDSITTRLLLKNILESAGYQVEMAADGLEALEIFQHTRVDLLLTDVEMPRMNGFELTERIRRTEVYKELPIVICTGQGSAEDRERGLELGANAYLDKNKFTQEELLNVAQMLL